MSQQPETRCLTCHREKDVSPLTYADTAEYVRYKIMEGIERGESLLSILEAAVIDGIPLRSGAEIMHHLRQINQEQIDYYKSPSHKHCVCSRCRVVFDRDKALCPNCSAETP